MSYSTTFLDWCRAQPGVFCAAFVADRSRPVARSWRSPVRYERQVMDWAAARGLRQSAERAMERWKAECGRVMERVPCL